MYWKSATASQWIPTPIIALSLRSIDGYSGYCVTVRRESDNATSEIGFVNGLLDIATAITFASGSNLRVTKVYDQSGNGKHAVQTTALLQPYLVDTTLNSKPSIFFNLAHALVVLNISINSFFTLFALSRPRGLDTSFFIEHGPNANADNGFFFNSTIGQSIQILNTSGARLINISNNWMGTEINSTSFSYGSDSYPIVKNNIQLTPLNITNGVASQTITDNLNIGSRNQTSVFAYMDLGELVIYNSELNINQKQRISTDQMMTWSI